MRQICQDKLIEIVKKVVAYFFLYGIFLWIFYDFAYNAWICAKPIGLMLVFLRAFVFLLLYSLVNHIIIKKIVGIKTIMIYETLLFLVMVVLNLCYAAIENRFHGDYSARTSNNELSVNRFHSEGMPDRTCCPTHWFDGQQPTE